ncbi:hypothetical protein A9Q84_02190 [Halobacteriovorax marinus]|uniref:Uncharacterized protein n=1 Tax=Halobacteriovorax marinus TaxID=97084 RepID=A0A1Y5FCN9_9BACT|nr:hypothetical protein A9Q84_02190 [Halobacteriovorax marinus]
MSSSDKSKRKGNKIYRGAYTYLRNTNIYCEETFEVFKEKNDSGLLFSSQLISRVSTGELLNITVDYKVNKDYTPTTVIINKNLGDENVVETFTFNHKRNSITYTFQSSKEEKVLELNTTPKFFISTPSLATSMLYLRSKKFDSTSKNIYNVLGSSNQWKYENEPSFNAISVQKISLTNESRNIEGGSVQGVEYRIQQHYDSAEEAEKDDQSLKCFVSQHVTIPYFLEDGTGTKIAVKYLNDLSERELD